MVWEVQEVQVGQEALVALRHQDVLPGCQLFVVQEGQGVLAVLAVLVGLVALVALFLLRDSGEMKGYPLLCRQHLDHLGLTAVQDESILFPLS